MTFHTPADYLRAAEADPSLSILPLQTVADFRGVSRAAIDAMIRNGRLEEIRIGKTRFVRMSSLIALQRDFDDKVDRVRKYLEERAREREIVFYEPVMAEVGLSPSVPADRTAIGGILGRVSQLTWNLPKSRRHLLSVIVHRKTAGRTRPGPGFLSLVEGTADIPDWSDEDELLDRETKRVWACYRPHSG